MVAPWESLIIGALGALFTILAADLFDKLQVDDPVSAVSVHGVGGIWVSHCWATFYTSINISQEVQAVLAKTKYNI